MAWKVFDIIIDNILTIKNKIIDIDENDNLTYDSNILATQDWVTDQIPGSVLEKIIIPIDTTNSFGAEKIVITIPSSNVETTSTHFSIKAVFAGNNYQSNAKFYYEGSLISKQNDDLNASVYEMANEAGHGIYKVEFNGNRVLEITPQDNTSNHSNGVQITDGFIEISMPAYYKTIDMANITVTVGEDII